MGAWRVFVRSGEISSEGCRGAPQLLQNLVSAALSELHLEHFMGLDLQNLRYYFPLPSDSIFILLSYIKIQVLQA
jgi:hypothetical protein